METIATKPAREVGVILLNRRNEMLVARRIEPCCPAVWQAPQGPRTDKALRHDAMDIVLLRVGFSLLMLDVVELLALWPARELLAGEGTGMDWVAFRLEAQLPQPALAPAPVYAELAWRPTRWLDTQMTPAARQAYAPVMPRLHALAEC